MKFDTEVEAYVAGFMAARSRLSDPLTLSLPAAFEPSVRIIIKELEESRDIRTYFGKSYDKVHVKFTEIPNEWLTEVPDPQEIPFNFWLAYVRGAFESNGCFTVSNKVVKDKTYSYDRIQFYFREGEEWIADFVRDSWHKWLGELGMTGGKDIAVSFIPSGQGNRSKDTFSFTVSGKREEVITEYMYHKASVSLLREDFKPNGVG